jgi:hypothetical protein
MGHGGVRLGRIDLNINGDDQKVKTTDRYYVIGEKTSYS